MPSLIRTPVRSLQRGTSTAQSIRPLHPLSYDDYNAGWWIVANSGIDPNRIDWTHVQPQSVKYTASLVNGQVVYNIDIKLLPLLDGKVITISGEISPKGVTNATIFGSNGLKTEVVKTNEQGSMLQKDIYDSNGSKANNTNLTSIAATPDMSSVWTVPGRQRCSA